eukprot:3976165-Alexandrium_andersonii.AAC.1
MPRRSVSSWRGTLESAAGVVRGASGPPRCSGAPSAGSPHAPSAGAERRAAAQPVAGGRRAPRPRGG